MRLVFLDFDGVLHPLEAEVEGRFCWLPVLAELLSTHPDVRIVVHSTWRYEYTDQELRGFLGPLGPRFVGSAPRAPREQAIETVLQANKSVRAHLVLDDDRREFSVSRVNLVLLDSQRGLSDELVQAAIRKWLHSTTPSRSQFTSSDIAKTILVTVRAVSKDERLVRADGSDGQYFLLNDLVMGTLVNTIKPGDMLELLVIHVPGKPSKILQVRAHE